MKDSGPRQRLSACPTPRQIHLPTLASFLAAGSLVLVGVVRVLSYYQRFAEDWIHDSIFGVLAYRPDDFVSVRYFKVLASLSVVSLLYLLFRVLNRGHRAVFPPGYPSHHRDLDFRSPWVRLALLAIVNSHWALQEWYKFATHCYPYSPLECWRSNAIVLTLSGLVAFVGMKYFSFRPLLYNAMRGSGEP